jgi:outer membrane usher protein FimD/PapC
MKLLMTLTHNGKPVPFGAIAAAVDSQTSSIVADNGQVYLSGMPLAGKVRRNGAKVRRQLRGRLQPAAGKPEPGVKPAVGSVPLRKP